jgi:hypothetical protein
MVDVGVVKGEFSYPLLPYLSKKVVSPPHLKILATPLQTTQANKKIQLSKLFMS